MFENTGTGGGEVGGSGLETVAAGLPPLSGIEETDDGYELTFGEPEKTVSPEAYDHYENIAETAEDSELLSIAEEVIEGFDADIASRADWETTLVRGLDLLGMRLDEGSQPFVGACMAMHPLIMENCVKFAAKAIAEIFPAGGPVKTQLIGLQTPELILSAGRVKEYMNFQLTEEMEEYFDEVERMLIYLAYAGMAMKKVYFDAGEERPTCEFVKATDFVISNYAVNLKNAQRYSHRMFKSKIDMDRDVRNGVYVDIDLGEPVAPKRSDFDEKMDRRMGVNQNQKPDRTPGYTVIEQHCYLADIFGVDGAPAPYIVTVAYEARKVLAIRRNWKESDEKLKKLIWFVKYSYVPSDGFYSWESWWMRASSPTCKVASSSKV